MLEENIAILESRIRELENPDESAPSVRLYDPSRTSGPSGQGNVEGSEGGRTPTLRLFDIGTVEPLSKYQELYYFLHPYVCYL